MCIIQYTLYIIYYTLYIIMYLYSIHYTLHIVPNACTYMIPNVCIHVVALGRIDGRGLVLSIEPYYY